MKNETTQKLSEILSELIESKKDSDYTLSEKKQAGLMDIPYQTFHKYVNGTAECPIGNLVKIAKYYNVTTDYLLGLTDNPSINPDIQNACEVTGLSDKAISMLSAFSENFSEENITKAGNLGLNHLLESDNFLSFANQLLDIYLIYRDIEKDIFDDICCAGINPTPLSKIENDVDKAMDLISLIGYKAISKPQYFELCLQNACYSLKEAFKDWLEEVSDCDYTDCYF